VLHVARYSCQILAKLELLSKELRGGGNPLKFHENSSGGSRVAPCGRTDGLVTKPTISFRNFAYTP